MKTPCEEIVWYVIPAIRAEFARTLVNDYGLQQKKVAKILDITNSAVSQYIKGKRGGQITDPAALDKIREISDKIVKENKKLSGEDICTVCKKIQKSPDYQKLVSRGITCGI